MVLPVDEFLTDKLGSAYSKQKIRTFWEPDRPLLVSLTRMGIFIAKFAKTGNSFFTINIWIDIHWLKAKIYALIFNSIGGSWLSGRQ